MNNVTFYLHYLFLKECIPPNVTNGKVLGNMMGVGNTIRVLCDRGYVVQGGPASVVCMDTGEWSHNVTCVQGIMIANIYSMFQVQMSNCFKAMDQVQIVNNTKFK